MTRFQGFLTRYRFVLACLLAISSFLTAQEVVEADGSILLPAQKEPTMQRQRFVQQQMTLSNAWQSFQQAHGQWSVQWNEATRTPHRAFGEAIAIPGYSLIHAGNVEAAARAFLLRYAAVLGIRPQELQLQRAVPVNGKWYVTFTQLSDGLPVLLSEVELRISDDGRVMAFGVDFYSEISLDRTPSISYQDARSASTRSLMFDPATDEISGEQRLYILPVRSGNNVNYHLVYRVDVRTYNPEGNYITYVDAHSGEIIWRHNRIRYDNLTVRMAGMVQLNLPTDPFVETALPNENITIGANQFTTDSLGLVGTTILGSTTLTARLEGPFANVNRQDGPDALITMTVNPNDSVSVIWDDSNSHPAERDAFFHTNVVHHFITTLDPNFVTINYSMPVAVNINQTCNAFWDGVGINFFLEGGGCPNTGQMPDVVYHEYGHGINDKLYQQAGSPQGMINGATHEGLSDVNASMLQDDPRVGKGFFGPGSVLRRLDNTNRYPDDVSGDTHITGLIIGGAFWDLRLATTLETARILSHFARYGTPDDPNDGVAFSEWFLETLIADDDDGNLGNGTPHFTEINNAFNAHGIGTSLFMLLSFSHTPVDDTADTLNAYPVNFHIEGVGLSGSEPDSVTVHFSTDNFQTTVDLPAAMIAPGDYQADIPPQGAGTVVRYFISAHDPLGGVTLRFPVAGAYTFLVGFQQFLLDELETDSGWTIGAPDDDATTGRWERADPEPTFVGSSPVQPGDDHTVNGTLCFVTEAEAGSGAGSGDIDNGKTTIFSPVYNLSTVQNPVLRYFKWYSNDLGNNPGQDVWVVDVSNDGGQNWVNIESNNVSSNGWEKVQYVISDFITPGDSVQFRFVASDEGPPSLVEALIDDISLLGIGVVVGIDDGGADGALPKDFALEQNYPNPFNPSTTIRYALPVSANIRVTIYNTLGQEVRSLFSGNQSAGRYSLLWDGRDNNGAAVASGIYIYKLQTVGGARRFVQSRKLILLK